MMLQTIHNVLIHVIKTELTTAHMFRLVQKNTHLYKKLITFT